jgi:hypothetical protein
MKNSSPRKLLHQSLRKLFSFLPRETRFAIYRNFVDCDPRPDAKLVLKIAETQEELEACFRLLHDAYVSSGFMLPDPSGMRVTIYHAMPTTTTLCAKFDGEVVGTMSLIRESVIGFPLQSIFDLDQVRSSGGNIAEVSALAIHPKFRKTGGAILFPLMKFMYNYCTRFFDTRHLVIAVNPNRIEMYESLLFFTRLTKTPVASYDFANGAPAVGATLDLHRAPAIFDHVYGKKRQRKNLYSYFVRTVLPNIVLPSRRYYTTNDPVMTPALLDYFFNQRTNVFAKLTDRKKALLHSIYNLDTYHEVLPAVATDDMNRNSPRKHQRFSVKCPGVIQWGQGQTPDLYQLKIRELSEYGFLASSPTPLPLNTWYEASIQLGSEVRSTLRVMAVRDDKHGSGFYGFKLEAPDSAWKTFVNALEAGSTGADLESAIGYLAPMNGQAFADSNPPG